MTTEIEATRIQLLVPHLTLKDVGDALLTKLKRLGGEYKWRYQLGTPKQRHDASSELLEAAYNISRMVKNDRELLGRFDDSRLTREEEEQTLVDILETLLLSSLDSKSRRWRDYASKIAWIFELLSKEGLSSNDIVSRLEGMGGIEKLI